MDDYTLDDAIREADERLEEMHRRPFRLIRNWRLLREAEGFIELARALRAK